MIGRLSFGRWKLWRTIPIVLAAAATTTTTSTTVTTITTTTTTTTTTLTRDLIFENAEISEKHQLL